MERKGREREKNGHGKGMEKEINGKGNEWKGMELKGRVGMGEGMSGKILRERNE